MTPILFVGNTATLTQIYIDEMRVLLPTLAGIITEKLISLQPLQGSRKNHTLIKSMEGRTNAKVNIQTPHAKVAAPTTCQILNFNYYGARTKCLGRGICSK